MPSGRDVGRPPTLNRVLAGNVLNGLMGILARRYVYLLLLVVLVPAGVQLLVWGAEAIEARRTPPAVKAARAFLAALRDGYPRDDACERALSLLTADSRSVFEAQGQEDRTRSARNSPRPRACTTSVPAARMFAGLQPKTARLISQENGRAVVGVERYEGDPTSYRIPGFWPSRWIITTAEMQLVEETGRWKVALP
jgi:hypothetical protein